MKRFFKALWEGWKKVGHAIGRVVNTVLLFVVYFTVILVAGLISKLTRWDPLQTRRPDVDSYWKPREPVTDDLERAQRLF